MNSVFITGTPTAGKSCLAEKVAKMFGIAHIKMDDARREMWKDPFLEPWVNFLSSKNEADYYRTITADEQWQNLVQQSEAFWPTLKKIIDDTLVAGSPAIFEGINLLPHLMVQVNVPGIVVVNSSENEILERLKQDPRWGKTTDLQQLEAHAFFTCERPRYLAEAEKFRLPSFSDITLAETELQRIILSH